jgi:hypothetical protein
VRPQFQAERGPRLKVRSSVYAAACAMVAADGPERLVACIFEDGCLGNMRNYEDVVGVTVGCNGAFLGISIGWDVWSVDLEDVVLD